MRQPCRDKRFATRRVALCSFPAAMAQLKKMMGEIEKAQKKVDEGVEEIRLKLIYTSCFFIYTL